MIRTVATMPLEGELVLTCADCGEPSTASLAGADGWTLRRVSAQRLVDVCEACSGRAGRSIKATAAGGVGDASPLAASAVRVGLAIDPGRHLSSARRRVR